MNDFAQWRNWAADLDDTAFSRLWRALGAVAALRRTAGAPADWIIKVRADAMRTQELRWALPVFDDSVSVTCRSISPHEWLDLWDAKIGERLDKAPMRIDVWPRHEPLGEWFAMLGSRAPVATLNMESRSKRKPGWPLRLAALRPEDRDVLSQATGLWPSGRLARIVGEHAGSFACDVLLFDGDIDTLMPQLEGGAVSANLVVLCMRRSFLAEDASKLDALMEATRAGGYIVVESAMALDLPGRLNRLVEELSHARRIDVAASLAFAGLPQPALIALSDTLARFTIREVAGQLLARSKAARPQSAPPSAIRRLLDAVIPRQQPPAPAPRGLESAGAEPEAESSGLESLGGDEDRQAAGEDGGDALEAMSPEHDELVPDFERLEAPFDRESGGATALAEAAEELDRAEATVSADRYLQQKAFVVANGEKEPASGGFLVGMPVLIEVFIGPPDRQANAMPDAFPEAALPQELENWDLRVWLSEPDHIPQPLSGDIVLRRMGRSTSCEFAFTPAQAGLFNGRISVLHRGRVIQTASLRASVTSAGSPTGETIAPTLGRVLKVRQNLSNLDRRPFDLAFVLNHAGLDQPTVHAMGDKRAWMGNLRVVEKTVADLNKLLSGLAKTARDYVGGLDTDKGKSLLRKLAQVGSYLHLYLVESQRQAAGGAAGANVLDGEFIQVVSTRSDAVVIPFEFIYAHDAPDDDATLCPNWREGVAAGRCTANCQHGANSFCPMGFWGLSKVIERHALQPNLANEGEVGVQSEAVSGRDTLKISGNVVFGYSDKVKKDSLAPLLQRMATAHLNASEAKDWSEWATLVGEHSPSLLIALAHSDGAGFSATVEIGGEAIKTIGITAGHIRAKPHDGERPLVALLGCDMAGTGDDYSNPVAVFTMRGAATVIGTIAT
ncbi:hypothetical protein, partial [Dokdonella sp.]|uniref:hypothetical protein n=1 Tax=Dokdonella sp. TaxID=2291710 RepID=UPI003C366C15